MTNLPYALAKQLVVEHQQELEGAASRWRLRRRRPVDATPNRHAAPPVLRALPPHVAGNGSTPGDRVAA